MAMSGDSTSLLLRSVLRDGAVQGHSGASCLNLHELNYAYDFTPGAGEPFVMEIADGSGRVSCVVVTLQHLPVLCSPVTFFFVLFRLETDSNPHD
jgi:hypothetical protein